MQNDEIKTVNKPIEKRYKCLLCGRDKFTAKQPHKCRGGFRKRKIQWAEVLSNGKTKK